MNPELVTRAQSASNSAPGTVRALLVRSRCTACGGGSRRHVRAPLPVQTCVLRPYAAGSHGRKRHGGVRPARRRTGRPRPGSGPRHRAAWGLVCGTYRTG